MNLSKLTAEHKCPKCAGEEFVLAVDSTEYSPCAYDGSKWQAANGHEESSEADNAVRFYCAECGEYCEVPKELT